MLTCLKFGKIMSANAALLPCPVCSHNVFETSESLRDRLIFVSTNKIPCPICQLEVTGIDKLTIHLFSHVKIVPVKAPSSSNQTSKDGKKNKEECQPCHTPIQQIKKSKTGTIKNKQIAATNAPVKFVKIYPKLPVISLNTVPVLDMTRASIEDGVRNSLYLPTLKPEAAIVQSNTTCNMCGLQFVDANILKVHRCLIHNIDENVNTTATKYQCHVCPKSFKMRGSLMVHMRVAHFGFMSADTKEANDQSILDDNNKHEKLLEIERNDNKQWQCDVCRKSFTTKYFLKKHKRLHTGETPYACGQCNKTFTFQQSYHKHLLYHNDEKPHVCSFCGRGFKELSTLHNHQRIHTGEKPFSCESCGKCFRQRVSYLVHRRIHTGAMPYKCTACNKSFRYKVSQRTHKCQIQPPGTVIRKTGELVEKLKRKQSNINSDVDLNENNSTIYPPDISESSAELVRTGARLSLEDTENDDFVLIKPSHVNEESNTHKVTNEDYQQHDEYYFTNAIDNLMDSVPNEDKNVPSPSEILKNLCLSPEEDDSKPENNVGLNYHEILDQFNDFLQ